MRRAFLLTVRFHEGRYHGAGDWPPSPARLFQALVAAVGVGETVGGNDRTMLEWVEQLDPPTIAAPPVRSGQRYRTYVPNNDLDAKARTLDAKGGLAARVAELRVAKHIQPLLFDAAIPLLYLWSFDEGEADAQVLTSMAHRLYQLGRGIDMAWATAELLDTEEARARLATYDGAIHRPGSSIGSSTGSGSGRQLACPTPGSFESLAVRHQRTLGRLRTAKVGREHRTYFSQPPKARFRQVVYDTPPERRLFDLRDLTRDGTPFHRWLLEHAAALVTQARDGAARRLTQAYEDAGEKTRDGALIDRVFGRSRETSEADKAARLRLVPIPSIGHPNAESSIRGLLLEIPPNCPLPRGDIAWSFGGLPVLEDTDSKTGEVLSEVRLVEATDHRMLDHYGIGGETSRVARTWHTITPVALPEQAARARGEMKNAAGRIAEEQRAAASLRTALRHAGIDAALTAIRVQREPLHAMGKRAEAFAPGTRFAKRRLWHVSLTFDDQLSGPLVIGDGRYLGLGLMAPVREAPPKCAVFSIGRGAVLNESTRGPALEAVRRALMAIDGGLGDEAESSLLFSGHAGDSGPARGGSHRHVFLALGASWEASHGGDRLDRLYVFRPEMADRTAQLAASESRRFERVVAALERVKAGRLGVLVLDPLSEPVADDRHLAKSRYWETETAYRPTRQPQRGKNIEDEVRRDVLRECRRRALPRPHVAILDLDAGPKGGNVTARVAILFASAVAGPILLGRDSHAGGGFFARAEPPNDAAR